MVAGMGPLSRFTCQLPMLTVAAAGADQMEKHTELLGQHTSASPVGLLGSLPAHEVVGGQRRSVDAGRMSVESAR